MPLKDRTNARRASLASPGGKGVSLTPNDDATERRKSRMSRASDVRQSLAADFDAKQMRDVAEDIRKETAKASAAPQAARGAKALSADQVQDLYQSCIKLAAENKISQKNTWSLHLIDHMSDLVRDTGTGEGSFQKASVTLDAGVKIYAHRVDNVHNETFRMMTSLVRGAAGADGDAEDGDAEAADGEPGTAVKRKRRAKDVDPSSTLEHPEAINAKKFDVTFAVDPLFHKTSAQFDEGGAKGLLLNNLSVYSYCDIMFDSEACPPDLSAPAPARPDDDVAVDLGPLSGLLEAALETAAGGAPLAPALQSLRAMLPVEDAEADAAGAHERELAEARAAVAAVLAQAPSRRAAPAPAGACDASDMDVDVSMCDLAEAEGAAGGGDVAPADAVETAANDVDTVDTAAVFGNGLSAGIEEEYVCEDDFGGFDEGGGFGDGDDDGGDRGGDAGGLRSVDLGSEALQYLLNAGQGGGPGNGWAGAQHWRFRRPTAAAAAKSAPRRAKADRATLDFENLPEIDAAEFRKPTRKNETVLASAPKRAATLLPDDCHYRAAALARPFLVPGRAAAELIARTHGLSTAQRDAAGAGAGDDAGGGWGSPGGFGDGDDDGGFGAADDDAWGGFAQLEGAAQAARRLSVKQVNYAQKSKQIDVRALKQHMWGTMQDVAARSGPARAVGFQEVVAAVPETSAAGRREDVSVHLAFICMLHLANENGLSIRAADTLDSVEIAGVAPAQ